MTVEATVAASPSERQRLIKQCVFIFLAACMAAAVLQINPGFLPTTDGGSEWVWNRAEGLPQGDGYYHIKAAWLYRTGEMSEAGSDFHWTRVSVWNGHYSDKDFLYHMYLVPFTLMAEDEFHWQAFINAAKFATIIAAGLYMLALFGAMRLMKVPRAELWTLAAGAMIGVLTLIRLTEPRSWVFSVCFAILGWAAIWRGKRKLVFAIAVLYVLAYTGCHLLMALGVFRLVFNLVAGSEAGTRKQVLKQDLIMLAVIFAGLVLGWALHPESFALLRVWWVQNIVVPLTHAGSDSGGLMATISGWLLGWPEGARAIEVPVSERGFELNPRPLGALLVNSTYEAAAPVLLPCLSAWLRVRPSRATVATFVLGVGFLAVAAFNGRFLEYSIPFLLLAGAMWMSEILAARSFRVRLARLKWPPARVTKVAVAILVAVLCLNLYRAGEMVGFRPRATYLETGLWLQTHDEVKGKVVYNISWDAFPELFMFRSDCDYIWGMDPVFTAARADKNARRVIAFDQQDMREWGASPADAVRVLREDFGAEYIFVHDRSEQRSMYNGLLDWAVQGHIQRVQSEYELGFALYRIPPEK